MERGAKAWRRGHESPIFHRPYTESHFDVTDRDFELVAAFFLRFASRSVHLLTNRDFHADNTAANLSILIAGTPTI